MLVLLIGFGVLAILGAEFYPEVRRLGELNERAAAMREEVHQLRDHRNELRLQYELLQTDLTYLESVARDRLDLMKPGETIFRIVREPAR